MSSLLDLNHVIGGRVTVPAALGEPDGIRIGRLAVDSRDVAPGDVFWALPNQHCDGDEFVDEAFAHGAAGAVVTRDLPCPADRWMIHVPDTAKALEQWAAHRRRQFTRPLIAVAGNVGKTTTRQMIQTVLGSRLRGATLPNSVRHDARFWLTLAAIEADDEFAVIEIGARAGGELVRMAAACRPTITVIPHVVETGSFGLGPRPRAASIDEELLSSLPLESHAVLADHPWLRRAAAQCGAPITWVGRDAACDVAASDVRWRAGRLSFRVKDCEFRVPVWGGRHLPSVLIAVAVGQLLGFTLEETALALEHFDSLPLACEVSEIRGATIIHVTPGASAASADAVLEMLRDFDAAGRRIVLLGDVDAGGNDIALFYRQLGNHVVTVGEANVLIACGKHAGDVVAAARAAGMPSRQAIACRTPDEAAPYLGQIILPGDVVLVHGAHFVAMHKIVDALKQFPRRRSA